MCFARSLMSAFSWAFSSSRRLIYVYTYVCGSGKRGKQVEREGKRCGRVDGCGWVGEGGQSVRKQVNKTHT